MKSVLVLVVLLFAAAAAPANVIIDNADFESPSLPGTHQQGDFVAGWTFATAPDPYGPGIAGVGSPFFPVAPDGQVALMQGAGSISQSLSGFGDGPIEISFDIESRSQGGPGANTIEVYFASYLVGTFSPANINGFITETIQTTSTSGTHVLEFRGVVPGDQTVFLDNVQITLLPEPASAGLLAGGAALLLARRRRA